MRTVTATCLVLLIVHQAEVRAEAPSCVAGSPGSPSCTERGAGTGVANAPAPEAENTWTGGTHSFFFPNGNLVPSGRMAVRIHEFGLYNTLSYGLSDHLEISVGAPVIPMIGSVGGRVSVTPPRSRFKAVVEGTAFVPMVADSGDGLNYVSLLAATVGYQTDALNVHATLGRLGSSEDDDAILLGSVGVAYATSDEFALLAEVSSATVGGVTTCASGSSCTTEVISEELVTLGVKYTGYNWAVDAGVLLPPGAASGDGFVYIPMITLSRLY